MLTIYRGADKSLALPGRKQARKHLRDARDFNNIETRAVIKFSFSLQGKAPKEIHAILTETLACLYRGITECYDIQSIEQHVSTPVLFILYKVRLHVSTIHVVILRSLISFKS